MQPHAFLFNGNDQEFMSTGGDVSLREFFAAVPGSAPRTTSPGAALYTDALKSYEVSGRV